MTTDIRMIYMKMLGRRGLVYGPLKEIAPREYRLAVPGTLNIKVTEREVKASITYWENIVPGLTGYRTPGIF